MFDKNQTIDRLEDMLVCDPFSRRGKDALERLKEKNHNIKISLTPEDFYEQLYVEPFFMAEKNGTVITTATDENDDDYAFSQEGIDYTELRNKKSKFENRLLSETTASPILIQGSSGSGKTIYLNKLKQQWKDINSKSIIEFDLEFSRKMTLRGSVEFPKRGKSLISNSSEPNAQWYFLVHLLATAYDTIEKIMIAMNDDRDKKVKNMSNNFKKFYSDNYSDDVKNIFDFICQSEFDSTNKHTLSGNLFQKLIDYCVIGYDDNNVNIKDSIINTLKIMTHFSLLYSNMKHPKLSLIIFDSIENYIDITTRIYDSDINVIVDSIYRFSEDEKSFYKDIGLDFSKYFKLIIIARDTTEKMFSISVHRHFADIGDHSIDVTNWYDTDEIFMKKFAYFELMQDDTAVRFLNLIVADKSAFNNSIMELVSMMYNFNKRRISGILTRVAVFFMEVKMKPEENQKVMQFDEYERYWSPDKENIIYKYMLRRSILRIIFNLIRTTKYFEFLYIQNNSIDDKSTYTRRVLTWLYRKRIENNNYVTFPALIKGVLQIPDTAEKSVTRDSIKDLARILVALDEYRFDYATSRRESMSDETAPNKWCQLIDIKFNDSNYKNSTVLAEKMWEEYNSKTSDENNYGVKITNAGIFLAYIQCDFEYFACRYDKSNTPLLLMRDCVTIKRTIQCVYERAKKCIDYVIKQEYAFSNGNFRALDDKNYPSRDGKDGLSFPYRVIKNHRQYLSHYRKILEKEKSCHLDLRGEKHEDIIVYIDEYLARYEKIFDDLKRNQYKIDELQIKDYFNAKYEVSV